MFLRPMVSCIFSIVNKEIEFFFSCSAIRQAISKSLVAYYQKCKFYLFGEFSYPNLNLNVEVGI